MVINKDIASGIFFVLLSAGLLSLVPLQIEREATQGLTARSLPLFVLTLMLIFSLLFLIKSIIQQLHKKSNDAALTIEWLKELKVLGLFVLIVLYVSSLPFIGYLIASSIMSVLLLMYLKVKKKLYYAAAIGLVFIIYFAFTMLLNIQLP
ncbi:tripartite tricarboxylate transporter TctB family protein [Salibacterium aidingense]|uniref:tripartite tricarboxylate transporter TctB family protein n=1 Tax=Salibacterium aidingense TaxID=384933 RepID=UPI003BCC3AA6